MMMKKAFALSCYLQLIAIDSFYLPGVPQHKFKTGDRITITANSLQSTDTQLSYDYYSLPFCEPTEGIQHGGENLGEKLSGYSIDSTPYKINMLQHKQCALLCKKTYSRDELDQFVSKIKNNYIVNLETDNLPAAKKVLMFDSESEALQIEDELQDLKIDSDAKEQIAQHQDYVYDKGYPLGQIKNKNIALNNHLDISILFNKKGNIVGFEVEEYSINHQINKIGNTSEISCSLQSDDAMIIDGPSGFNKIKSMDILWTYAVTFRQSDKVWATRWDPYLKMRNPQVHWFQITNSFMMVILLSASVGITLIRVLKKDLIRYRASLQNDFEKQKLIQAHSVDNIIVDEINDFGWKIVHGDVFRKPKHPFLFSILISSGLQTFLMSLTSILFSALGFLSPVIRGSLISTSIFFFALFGWFNGYYSARLFKLFDGEETEFKKHIAKTALFYPIFNFIVFIIIDLIIWMDSDSTNAVPFGTLLALIVIWFLISFPMVYFGGCYGYYKLDKIKVPCRVRRIPRVVPTKPWFLKKESTSLIGGIIVFGSVFIELIYIISSVWNHQYYYVFGFLLLIFLMLSIVSAQVSILLVYSRLNYEDYNWWYSSFFTPATSGAVVFVYSIYYFCTSLNVAPILSTYFIYFGYMLLISVAFALITGFAGFYGSFCFVKIIYNAIKSD